MARVKSPAETDVPVEEILARESEWRTRAGIASILAGVLTLGGGIAAGLVYQDLPSVLLLDALRDAAGQDIGREGLRTAQIQFYDDKMVTLLLLSGVLALGALLTAVPLSYLARATSARRKEFPRSVIYAVIAGPALVAISGLMLQVVVAVRARDFVSSGDFSTRTAHDVLQASDLLIVSQILRQVGVLAIGFAFVLVALNAMRAGLLTRFMGTLGIIVGVLFVIPIGGQLPVVQAFWLVALGFLFMQLWTAGGVPPAWQSGRAEPWPTQQELREARERAKAGAASEPEPERRKATPPPPSADDTPAPSKPHVSSNKKKRKRR
ncbi:hypothetical protein GKE82_11790 [Conexibacter sp. W3-3-2]|uniref:hypothetical protein n=1 Tax=Conexibacter sp. W3-3-2 TaxID=2675227 RepID=UPI0012B7A0DB|nr:hypothetical protein [Conexibacter sp. W3-3-2]MTD44952.1 hypothetical protein [Conexibacter sp. W3-3-2]